MSTRKRTRKSAISTIQKELNAPPVKAVANLTLVEEVEVKPEVVKSTKVKLIPPSIARITTASNKDEICTASRELVEYDEKQLNQMRDQRDIALIVALVSVLIGAVL